MPYMEKQDHILESQFVEEEVLLALKSMDGANIRS